MATVTKPIALDESLNTTEQTPRNVADVLAQELARIAGRQASDVNYDNTDSGLTADNVQDAIDELKSDIPTVNDGMLTIQQNGETKGTFTANQSGNSTVNIEIPTTDIQTAVDEFSTYNGGLLSSCKVTLSPNQDLHGYDHPWVGGAGKNLLPLTVESIKTLNSHLTWVGNKTNYNSVDIEIDTDDGGNVIGISTNGIPTNQCTLNIARYSLTAGNYVLNGCPSGGSLNSYYIDWRTDSGSQIFDGGNGSSYTSAGQSGYMSRIIINSGTDMTGKTFYPMIREASQSATFAPYSNICPISGHTQVEVDVSDGQTTQEQITVNLGGTYYSGVLDVVTGVMVATWVSERMLNTYRWALNTTPITDRRFQWNYGSGTTIPKGINQNGTFICSHLKPSNLGLNNTPFGYFYISQSWVVIPDRDSFFATLDDFKDWLSDNEVYICYKLATPQTIQLTPQQVKALVGENHLSAPLEGQEITESKYKQMFTFDDVIAYIQSLS